MLEKHLEILEFNKVLELLEDKAAFEETKLKIKMLRPCTCFAEAQKLQEQSLCAQTLILRYAEPELISFGTLSPILCRVSGGAVLAPKDLLSINMLLKTVQNLVVWSKNFADLDVALTRYFNELRPLKALSATIDTAIISVDEISSAASGALNDVRSRIANTKEQIRGTLEEFVRSSANQKYLQESIVTVRNNRFVVLVKSECRNEVKGLIHDTSASGSTLFVEPVGIVQQNNRLRMLLVEEHKEIERILQALSEQVCEQLENIQNNHRLLIFLDVILAKARLAISMDGLSPKLTEDGIIDLKKARHPLLPKGEAVPIDICVGGDFSLLVITGPNTGGKTVTLKTVGLLSLMAMSGLLIPVGEDSVVSFFDHVLADIGDEQSIEQSLSTFSGHIKNIVDIFEVADGKSLVLLDELGAGTDPVEGAALAIAILEELRARGCRAIATTHYTELKTYALVNSGVENGSCEFDIKTLQPTYKLSIGVPGRSNAFAIAQRLGFDAKLIAVAKTNLDESSVVFENVLHELNEIKGDLQEQVAQNQQLKKHLNAEHADIQGQKRALREQEEKLVAEFMTQAEPLLQLIEDSFDTVAAEIREIKQTENINELERLRNRVRGDLAVCRKFCESKKNSTALQGSKEPLKKGDLVLIESLQKEGILVDMPNRDGVVTVRSGNMVTKLKISQLKRIEKPRIQSVMPRVGKKFTASRGVKNELKLLGLSVDEALTELDRFVDDAVLAGLHSLWIVHGKGTGKLRAAVHEYLRSCAVVKSFRLGRFGEGEDGVTIVDV
ncbi:MAG: endonuclease MutS2 [Oscillospiraceae bacterium]|jgi:DNA mismatch repair protein MutS2|nr:endonuclease MutS2 [Oscillospiraceae bacterium]